MTHCDRSIILFAVLSFGAVFVSSNAAAQSSTGAATPPPPASAISGEGPPPAAPATGGDAPPPRFVATGYLAVDRVPDHNVFLPPPPAVDTPLGVADVAIFAATRSLENTPRWALAQRDDRVGLRVMLGEFGCALGVDLTAAATPAIARLLARTAQDLRPIVAQSKDKYLRPRPFVTEAGPICISPSEDFARSGSYPSGHAARGWLYALLLAEIDPQNAAAIVARGRVFGESRVVCGVHYASDIEGGRLTASALVAALHGDAEFEADVDAARAELAALRAAASPPAAAACEADAAHRNPPW